MMKIGSLSVAYLLMTVVLHLSFGEAFLQPALSTPSTGTTGVVLQAAERAGSSPPPPGLTQHKTPPALNVPVFSLATVNEDGSTNMNIVTYASPVGMQPERLWMVSLYKSTLSYENFLREGWGVLQILRQKHAPLVTILGQNSGRETDKAGRCAGEAFPWEHPPCKMLSAPKVVSILPDCTSYITLQMVSIQSAGDHDAAICRIGGIVGPHEDQRETSSELNTLETQHLREKGVI